MAMMTGQFDQIAQVVTQRTAELLCAQVSVVNERGVVVASSEARAVGRPFELDGANGYVRIPLRVEGQAGEVIVAEPANDEVISPRMAQVMVELVVNQTAVLAHLPNQQMWKDRFIHNLLVGQIGDEADVVREGQMLGMDLKRPRAVILIDAADYILAVGSGGPAEAEEAQIRRRSQLLIASIVSFFHLPTDTICAHIGNGEVAVLKASSTQDLGPWTGGDDGRDHANASWANLTALKRAASALLGRLQSDARAPVSIGIGRYHPGIHGLARSYQDARAALSLGRRFHGGNGVYCLDGLGIAAFIGVSDERTKVDLARHLLSPLEQERELRDTLRTFFAENCCPSTTAHALAIHRNTLSYRLDKIASLTGLDPRRFEEAVQLRLALLLLSLRDHPT